MNLTFSANIAELHETNGLGADSVISGSRRFPGAPHEPEKSFYTDVGDFLDDVGDLPNSVES